MMRTPLPLPSGSTSTGITVLFVAKPIPTMSAAGFSRKVATVSSSAWCTAVSPHSRREAQLETPYSWRVAITSGVQTGSTPPKPR